MLELTVKKEIEIVIKSTGDQVQVLSDVAECARRWVSDRKVSCLGEFGEKRVNAMIELMSDIFEATK